MKKMPVIICSLMLIISACAAGLKITIKPREDELTDLRAMALDLSNRHWYGRVAVMKTNIRDQVKRIIYGLENNIISTEQAARATTQAKTVFRKMDEIAKNPVNEGWLSAGDSGSVGEFREFAELKQMLDGFYSGAALIKPAGTASDMK